MKRRGICVLCLLALTLIGCKSTMKALTAVPEKPDRATEFQQAIKLKNTKQIARLIKKSTPEENVDGLHSAIRLCSLEAVTLFLKAGVDVNSVESKGAHGTPLITACELGNKKEYDIVKLLLEKKADVNVVDDRDYTALRYAVGYECADIVRLLIRYGANVNRQYDGHTLLYFAQIMVDNTNIANLLRKAGAKPAEGEKIEVQEAERRSAANFYNQVIYRTGIPLKIGDRFWIRKDSIQVLDRTTTQAGYTYLVTYYWGRDHAYSLMGGGTKYCFYIVSKRQIALHQNYSFTKKEQYVTSVNNLEVTCIGMGKYQHNYQDVSCYMFSLDAEQ